MKHEDLKFLLGMARSPVRNYIVPGLTSSIIGAKHEGGCVRLFSSTREQQDVITPHSHRFDLLCMVLKGQVKNRLWMHTKGSEQGDLFVETTLTCDALGSYRRGETQNVQRRFYDTTFKAGDTYSMKAAEVHSIYFGAGAEVLFFEGPQVTETSVILEPLVDGEHIKTFDVKPWMFQKAAA